MTNQPQSRLNKLTQDTKQTQSTALIPGWRFWLPLLFQSAIILAAPAQPLYTQLTGKTVILQTVPVDPFDFLRGYSQTLRYDISRPETLRQLPGWNELVQQPTDKSSSASRSSNYLPTGTKFYVILEAPASAEANPPHAWKAVKLSRSRPQNLATNQVALQGKSTGNLIAYGLETYYFPEDQRERINKDINQVQWGQLLRPGKPRPFVVEVKVDAQGKAIPISLWVRDRHYRF